MMMNLSLALFILYGFLLLSNLEELIKSEGFCTATAVILHFALFSSLSWMMAEALYLLFATIWVKYQAINAFVILYTLLKNYCLCYNAYK